MLEIREKGQSLSEAREARVRAGARGQRYPEVALVVKPLRCGFGSYLVNEKLCDLRKVTLPSEPLVLCYKNAGNDTYQMGYLEEEVG